jgi:predicted PurR-regulated permease PerM
LLRLHLYSLMTLTRNLKTALSWLGIAACGLAVLWMLGPVLTPFMVAAVLAYALTPLVNRLDALLRGRVPRVLAVLVVEAAFVVLTLCLLLLVVPIMAKEIPLMREQLPQLADALNVWLKPLAAQLGLKVSLDAASVKAFALKYLNANFEDLFASLLASLKLGGSVALTLIGNAVLVPVALFYLLMDWAALVARVMALVPPRLQTAVDSFTGEADTVLGQYLRGQLLVMGLMAVFYSTGLALFGLDLALPIGVFTGLAMFVPYLGFGTGLVLAVLAGLLQFASVKALIMVAVVFGTGQILEGFVLTPRLVGKRIGLHPLAVIFALLAFGQVFGLAGVLVALPASAVLLVAIRRVRANYLASQLYNGKQAGA